jgi:hypothetical protein
MMVGSNIYHPQEHSIMSASTTFRCGALLAVAALAGCSASGPSSAGRQVAFQLATRPATPAAALMSASAVGTETITLGTDVIVVSSVELVLRQIELERVGGTVCDTTQAEDDCEELKAGPVLLDLPLGVGASHEFTVTTDTGTFEKIKFEIHKPQSGGDDVFLAAHPDFDGISIRVIGTFNGVAFTYTSKLEAEQEHEFVPPLTVTESSGANVTLMVDLTTWFRNAGGTGLVDPATALTGQPNEELVKGNIEQSFDAFEDDNHDGEDDHGVH